MADDTQVTIPLVTASAIPQLPGVQQFYGTRDSLGNVTLQSTPRVNGAQVDSSNPMPTIDAAGNTALAAIITASGTPADGAWVSGAGSLVALLKGIFGKLAGTLSVNQAATPLTNSASGVVGTAAAIIVPFSANRKWLMISNRTSGTETHDIGSSNVLVGSGIPIAPGGGFLFSGSGAAGPVYGITGVTGSPFSYVEG